MASPTIPQIKTQIDTSIRQKTLNNSITPDDVADQFDALADTIAKRGLVTVANTAALELLSGTDTDSAIVTGIGLFKYSATGTANGTTVFTATNGGFWALELSNAGSSYSESIYGS